MVQARVRGMDIDQLISCIRFEPDKRNSRFVRLLSLQNRGNFVDTITRTSIPGEEIRFHRQRIMVKMRRKNAKPFLLVFCDCGRWLYQWEFSMAKRGATTIKYGNGEPPVETNRSLQPGICIAKGTYISTRKGLIKIENIKRGDEVYTLKGLNKVLESRLTGINERVYKFTTNTGRILKVTPKHIMYVLRNGLLKEVYAKDVLRSDNLIIGANHKYSGKKVSKKLARLVGYLVSEGSGSDRSISFHNKDKKLIKDYVRCLRKCFPDIIYSKYYTKSDDCYNVIVYKEGAKIINKVLKIKWGSYNIEIPKIILESDRESQLQFLYTYSAGDGHITKDYYTAGTVSKKLAEQLQLIFLSFGISATKNLYITGVKNSPVWYVRFNGRDAENFLNLIKNPYWAHDSCINTENRGYLNKDKVDINGFDFVTTLIKKYISKLDAKIKNIIVSVTKFSKEYGLINKKSKDCSLISYLLKKEDKPLLNIKNCGTRSLVGAYTKDLLHVTYKKRCSMFCTQLIDRKYLKSDGKLAKQKINKFINSNNLPRFIEKKLEFLSNSNIYFEPIRSIKIGKVKKVYDLTVDNEPNFYANGILVHNCKHIFHSLLALKKSNIFTT